MSHGHQHMSGGTQNQGNVLGDRSCVRQSKLYRKYESGNDVKAILGTSHLQWRTDKKEGAYAGHEVYDFDRHHGYSLKSTHGDSSNTSMNRSQSTNKGAANYAPPNYLIKNMKIIGGKLVDVSKMNSDNERNQDAPSYTSHSYSNTAAHHHSNSNAFMATQPLNDSSNHSHAARQQPNRNDGYYQDASRRSTADDDIKERARKYIAQFEMRKENPRYDDDEEDMYDSRRTPPAYASAARGSKPVTSNAVTSNAFPGNRNTTGNSTRPW